MNPECDKLMQENMSKNLIDQDEYPMTRMSSFLWDTIDI
jgi:glutamate decarboxylase